MTTQPRSANTFITTTTTVPVLVYHSHDVMDLPPLSKYGVLGR